MKEQLKYLKHTGIFILFLIYVVFEIFLSEKAADCQNYIGIIIIFLAGIMVMNLIIQMRENMKLHQIGFSFVLLWGIVIGLIMPPGIAPDEPRHFLASYELSNRILGTSQFGYDKVSEETGYPIVMMRRGDFVQLPKIVDWQQGVYLEEYNEISNAEIVYSSETDREMVACDKYTVAGSLFKYIPSALGITLARILHLGSFPLMYLGRFCNLVFFSICLFLGIRQLEKGKYALLSVATMPFLLCLASSYSYDAISNGLAIIVLAYFFSMYENEEKVSIKNIIMMMGAYIFILPYKEIYVLFGILILGLICKYKDKGIQYFKKLDRKKRVFLVIGAFFAVTIVLYREIPVIVNYAITLYKGQRNLYYGGDLHFYGIEDFISAPKEMLYVMFDSIQYYLGSVIMGSFSLPWVGISTISYWGLFFCCLVVVLKPLGKGYEKILKNTCFITFILLFLLALVGCLLGMTNRDQNIIWGFQARYMLPGIIMLMISYGTNEKFEKRLKEIFAFQNIFLFIAVLNMLRNVVLKG